MKRLALLGLLLLSVTGARTAALQEAPLVVDDERVKAPKRVKLVRPQYPPEARAQGIRGIVILALTIDTEGKISNVEVVRSIPGLDEAAIEAARQWEYEPPRVDGKPASVKVTVPITFALELPALTRQAGIPELRSGATPVYPKGAEGQRGSASADVTLDAEGRVAQAEVLAGESPWIEALLQALRTWVFAPEPSTATVSFRVEAEFEPGARGTAPRVALNLTGLRRSESMATGGPAPRAQPTPVAAPAASAPAPEAPPAAAVPPMPEPSEAPHAEPAGAPSAVEPTPTAQARPETPSSAAPAPEPKVPPPAAAPPASLGKGEAAPAGGTAKEGAAQPSIATPPTEVLRGAPPEPAVPAAPTPPPGPGTSSVRDVTLDVGIPDLASGRRPVVPPIARLQGVDGVVSVRFSIDGAGDTLVQAVEGPELLQAAARAMVASWRFQRASRERVFAVAEVLYRGDGASARVHRAD